MKVSHPGSSPSQGSEAPIAKHAARNSPLEAREASPHLKAEVESRVSSDSNTDISTKSREFAQAKALASAAPDVREELVSPIKRKIADGTYHIDHQAIADRLVEEHLKMPEGSHSVD